MPDQPTGSSGSDQLADARTDFVHIGHAQCYRHPAMGAEEVDGERHHAAGRLLEQQRGSFGPDGAGHDLADLQGGVDPGADPMQLTRVG